MSIDFLLTSLIIVVSPGTGVLYTMATGLSRGARASVVAAFGCTLGIVPHMAAAIIGPGGAAAHQRARLPDVQVSRRRLSALHGLDDAEGARRAQGREAGRRRSSAMQVIVSAILINILNPKLSIFFFAFLPQFVSADEAAAAAAHVELSGVFMLLTFVVFVGYGLFAASIRSHVISRPRVLTWMRRTFAGAFAALGAKLALADR